MARDYHNEWDPHAAKWLRNLIAEGLLPPGDVDERSIVDVKPADLEGYTRCHFFSGIGGWAYALRLAGWPDDRPVWTASCPCQPLSSAGKRQGHADERHLWPALFNLALERSPPTIFGEQVARGDGLEWLAGIRADLEGARYAFGAANLPAAGVGAPHARERLYWVANADDDRRQTRGQASPPLGYGDSADAASRAPARLAAANGYNEFWWSGPLQVGWNALEGETARGGRKHRAQWRIKPGISILADGISGRVEQLRAYGNAICPQIAAEFIRAAS